MIRKGSAADPSAMDSNPVPARPIGLLVDGDGPRRAVLGSWLTRSMDVLEAADVPTALAIAGQRLTSVVIADLATLGDGVPERVRRLKESPHGVTIPVVVLAAPDAPALDGALQAGADDWVGLPTERRSLELRVREVLRTAERARFARALAEDERRRAVLRSQLVAATVHDLRSPLAGVRAILEAMSLREEGPFREQASSALRGIDQVHGALEDLLRVRWLEDDQVQVSREDVRLRDLVNIAAAVMEPTARGGGVEVVVGAGLGGMVRGDPVLLQRAVEHLLATAIRRSPRGSVVEVDLTARTTGVGFQVSDRSPLPLPDLREVPSVGEGARSPAALGGYLVLLVATAHDGRVWVSARPGGGATFQFELPRRRVSRR